MNCKQPKRCDRFVCDKCTVSRQDEPNPASDFSLGPARSKIIVWCFIPHTCNKSFIAQAWAVKIVAYKFCFVLLNFVSVYKHAKKELGQYSVNNPYVQYHGIFVLVSCLFCTIIIIITQLDNNQLTITIFKGECSSTKLPTKSRNAEHQIKQGGTGSLQFVQSIHNLPSLNCSFLSYSVQVHIPKMAFKSWHSHNQTIGRRHVAITEWMLTLKTVVIAIINKEYS